MKLLSNILSTIPEAPVPVKKVLIGVHWTLVSSKTCGLGATLTPDGPHGSDVVRDVGRLHEKSAQELAGWVLSENLLEASIGMAAINSLIEVDESRMVEINAAEVLAQEGAGKNVAVIGHFPFIERLKRVAGNFWVIEKRPFGEDFPEAMAAELLPRADVIAITATTFINHTIEGLLPLCRPEALVMVLGPSTPLTPLLFEHGITYLSGSRVVDENLAETTILQGATFQQVQGVRRVTMARG